MFGQPGRLTAIAIGLHDLARLPIATHRLQQIPGAQVVTMTEMMGTFRRLVGAVRTVMRAIAIVAITASALSLFNTLLAAVVERTTELSLMRAVGASRLQIFGLVTLESLLLTAAGGMLGVALASLVGHTLEHLVKQYVPLAPTELLMLPTAGITLEALAIALVIGLVAGLYPAWQASRLYPALAAKME
jgi:putative ABC transport system permease protein